MNVAISKTRLRFAYHGKRYNVGLESRRYAETIIVNKLLVGQTRVWLILQNQTWRFISDMPLCKELKTLIAQKVGKFLGFGDDPQYNIAGQVSLRTGIMLNAVLRVLAVKKDLI